MSHDERLKPDNNLIPSADNFRDEMSRLNYKSVESNKFSQQRNHHCDYRRNENDARNWMESSSQTYFNIVKQLACGKFPENVPIDVLPFVPIMSMQFNDELYFSQNCLQNWWFLLRDNARNVDRATLPKAIVGLEKLNLKTNGFVLKIIDWDVIQRLAAIFLDRVSNDTVSTK